MKPFSIIVFVCKLILMDIMNIIRLVNVTTGFFCSFPIMVAQNNDQ
jgi:hypothetical protein